MAIKDCGHQENKRKLYKRIFWGIVLFIVIVLLIILIAWAILKPTRPTFILQDATLYSFNLTGPAQLTSIFQITVQVRNPNDKVGVYYDRLTVYATYGDQQITLPVLFPATYQDTNGMNVWSPFLQGLSVPIAPYIGAEINQDLSMGSVRLVIKMDGKVRFKVGTFVSATYRIHVNCLAIIPIGNPSAAGILVARNAIKYQLVQSCSVSV